jgi:hypothetical protein
MPLVGLSNGGDDPRADRSGAISVHRRDRRPQRGRRAGVHHMQKGWTAVEKVDGRPAAGHDAQPLKEDDPLDINLGRKPRGSVVARPFLIVDDHSRLLVHGRWMADENARAGQAVLRAQSPGAASLTSSTPIEGRVIRDIFVLEAEAAGIESLDALNDRFCAWVETVLDVGGRKVTMDVLRVKPEDATNTYALSFVMTEQVNGQTFNFSGLCFTGRSTSSPACSTLFQSWTWEPQATAPGPPLSTYLLLISDRTAWS